MITAKIPPNIIIGIDLLARSAIKPPATNPRINENSFQLLFIELFSLSFLNTNPTTNPSAPFAINVPGAKNA